jgi:hypothetical protein
VCGGVGEGVGGGEGHRACTAGGRRVFAPLIDYHITSTNYKENSCSLPRLHDHDPTTREDLGGGVRGPGPARVGLLGLQCSASALFRAATSFKIK